LQKRKGNIGEEGWIRKEGTRKVGEKTEIGFSHSKLRRSEYSLADYMNTFANF
jgi:hypothetical protein